MFGGNNCNVHDNFINDISQKNIGGYRHIYIGGANQADVLLTWRCSVHNNIANEIDIGPKCQSCKVCNNTTAKVTSYSVYASTNKIYDNYV